MDHKIENKHGRPGLDQWVIDDLNKSGLTLNNFNIEPLISETQLINRLGFTHIGGHRILEIGGYWIPYPDFPNYYRLRLKRPIETNDGTAKYLSPGKKIGLGTKPYIPFGVEEVLNNYSPDKPVFITEGEKKSAKATLEGFPCIGLSGVWNFKDSESDFLSILDGFIWRDCTVYIVFDSDLSVKHSVKLAELRLAIKLTNRGAKVYSVRLPSEPNVMFTNGKNGLDDFLVRYKSDAFSELVKKAKPTLELIIESDMTTERLLEEIATLKLSSEKTKWLKMLASKRGTSSRALCKDIKIYESRENLEPTDKNYIAYFPELVDLVEDDTEVIRFLVKEGENLVLKANVEINGETFYPPEREQLPFKFIPHAAEVIGYFTKDDDWNLFEDLTRYFKLVSELPDEKFYRFMAAWVLHTYLIECFEYSPYVWLYAIPERGKTRTGKGVVYVSYRAVHVESMRDAYLIRIANNLMATIFFDCMDLWRKAEKSGSEDFLLQRFERGAKVARVLYPGLPPVL